LGQKEGLQKNKEVANAMEEAHKKGINAMTNLIFNLKEGVIDLGELPKE